MRVFFDEDLGTGVPRALIAVRAPAEEIQYPAVSHARVKKGTPDSQWIPWAGANGWLVVSQDLRMLATPVEFELLRDHRVGIVIITSGNLPAHTVLRLLLNRWDWLNQVDSHVQRPFAFLLSPAGRVSRHDFGTGPLIRRP